MAYLNSFSDPQPQRRSAKPFLWVYSAKNEARYQTTKECATENYFYCFDKDGARSFEVEHAIADLENLSLPLLLRAQQGELPASVQDRLTFAGYVALAATRTPTAKSIFNQVAIDAQVNALREIANVPGKLEAILGEREMESGEKLDADEERRKLKAGKMRAVITERDWSLRCMFEETLRMQSRLVKMDWTLIRAKGAFFLTSDFPVLLSNPLQSNHVHKGTGSSPDFLFPISRHICLAGGTGFGREDLVVTDAAQVRKINLALIKRADRFVFSPFRAPYVQQKLDQSFEIREVSKVGDVIQL
jgi:hypothetical protein